MPPGLLSSDSPVLRSRCDAHVVTFLVIVGYVCLYETGRFPWDELAYRLGRFARDVFVACLRLFLSLPILSALPPSFLSSI